MSINKCYQTTQSLQDLIKNKSLPFIISRLSKIDIEILYHLFNYQNIYTAIFVARNTIAKKMGISDKTFTRHTNLLQELGLLSKARPDGKPFDVCHYKLTEFCISQKNRWLNWYNYYKFMGFSITLLVTPTPIHTPDVPLYSSKELSLSKRVYSTLFESASRSVGQSSTRQVSTEKSREGRPPTKKEREMKQDWLTPSLKAATQTLNLSNWGQIRLSAYPKQAIDHALKVYNSSKSKKADPFSWFATVCNEWCKKNNVAPDWNMMHRLAIENEMPDNPVLILEGVPLSIPTAQTKKRQESDLYKRVSAQLREKTQERLALKLAEDIRQERAYLMGTPDCLAIGRRLGSDMSRWDLEEKVVTEVAPQIECPEIEKDDKIWDNVKFVPVEDDGEWQEIF